MRLSARSIAEFGERHYGGPELDDSSTCQTHRPDYEPFSFLRRKKRRKITPFSTRRCLTCGRRRVSHAHSAPYVDNGPFTARTAPTAYRSETHQGFRGNST